MLIESYIYIWMYDMHVLTVYHMHNVQCTPVQIYKCNKFPRPLKPREVFAIVCVWINYYTQKYKAISVSLFELCFHLIISLDFQD